MTEEFHKNNIPFVVFDPIVDSCAVCGLSRDEHKIGDD